MMYSAKICCLFLALLGLVQQESQARSSECHSAASLHEAVLAAKKGDTVMVLGNLCFQKSLVIETPIALIGIQNPSLDFQSQSAGIQILCDSVEISGLNIYNIKRSNIYDYAAIYAEECSHLFIHHNFVYNAFFGIYLANSKLSEISSNHVEGIAISEQTTGNAVHLWHCDSILISDNHVSQHRDGIYLEFVTNSDIEKNISTQNIRYGLHFMFSHHDNYSNNQFLRNEAGVAVMYSNHVKMIANLFQDNWGDCSYGLLLKDIYDGELTRNVFDRNTIALLMEGTNRLKIKHNLFDDNGWGLKIAANCEGNQVEENVFRANSFDLSTNGHTVMNSFDRNFWDQFQGYDLDRDGLGDTPFHPVSLFAVLSERVPEALVFQRSFLSFLLDQSEHVMPSVTPDQMVDNHPLMRADQILSYHDRD